MIPMVTALLEQCEAAGIPCDVVQSTRTMSEQERIYAQGRTAPGNVVSNAKPGDSYHNYGLAVDIVPRVYRSLPSWNPSGPLWARVGEIGKNIGLEWGGDWSSKDLPHFQLTAAPLSELKAYWKKFQAVMPIAVTPSDAGLALAAGLAAVWFGFLRPQLKKRKMLA